MAFATGTERGDEDVMSEINMIPLVDIMLVLLIIFMITVPVVTHTVRLELPRAANEKNQVEPETITIAITEQAEIHWNQDVIDEAVLANRLAALALTQPQPTLQIRGDRKVAYEHVVKVMAEAQRAGVLKLGFLTEPGG